jgi:hypothetical protein
MLQYNLKHTQTHLEALRSSRAMTIFVNSQKVLNIPTAVSFHCYLCMILAPLSSIDIKNCFWKTPEAQLSPVANKATNCVRLFGLLPIHTLCPYVLSEVKKPQRATQYY